MATIPTFEKLGTETPRAARQVISYQPVSGQEEAPAQAADKFGELVSSIALRQQQELDTTRAEDAWNTYKAKALDLSAGQGGFLTKRAGNAINGDLFKTYTGALGDARKAIEDQLPNDEVRRRFTERANVTDLSFRDQLLRHYTAERLDYEKQTFTGSLAAANAMVRAAPFDQGAFDLALLNVTERAKKLADLQGLTDPNARKKVEDDARDTLLTARVDALLYSNPVAADALFRLHEKQFADTEKKLVLQHRVREASLRVGAANAADQIITEVRSEGEPRRQMNGLDTPVLINDAGDRVDTLAQVKRAIRSVEASGPNAVSVQGARGSMQITPDTFRQYAKPGESYDNEAARVAAAERKIEDDYRFYGGDIAKTAAAYIGGRGAVDEQGQIRDVRDALGTSARSYAQRVAALVSPAVSQTAGIPSARDIRAQLPLMLAKVEAKANELYGRDISNPDRAAFIAQTTNELKGKIALEVSQMEGIQRQAQGALIDFISGNGQAAGMVAVGADGRPQRVTSFSQLQGNPEMMRAWMLTDPATKVALERMIDSNAHQADAGNNALYWQVFNRIHQEPGSPGKIDFYQQILPYAGPGQLSTPQIATLRAEIDRNETPGGRSVGQMMRMGAARVEQFFKTTPMFTMQPERQMAATMKWTEDVGRKVDEYAKAGKDARTLFMVDTPDSMVKPEVLATYVNSTPAQGLSEQAAKVRAGEETPPVILDPKNPNATYNSLQPGARYKGPDGVVRVKPGAGAASAAPASAPPAIDQTQYGTRTDGSPKGAGYFGELKRPDGKASTELAIGVNVDGKEREIPLLVPGLTQGEIDQLLTLKEGEALPPSIIDKAVEHARSRIAAGKDPFAQAGEQGNKPATQARGALPVLEEGSLMERRRASADERQVLADERERLLRLALSKIPRAVGGAIVTGVQATGEGVRQAVAVPARVGSAIAQAIPTEQERYANAFRGLLERGRYTLQSADTIAAAMESGLLTGDEQAKAVAMMRAIAERARK